MKKRDLKEFKNPYEVFGISENADQDDIKKRFRELVQEYHPDKSTGNTQKYIEVMEAYKIIGDEKSRYQFDNYGTIEKDNEAEYQVAIEAILMLIMDIFKHEGDKVNVISLVEKTILNSQSRLREKIVEMKEDITLKKSVIPRFKNKNKKGLQLKDIIVDTIKKQIKDVEHSIISTKDIIKKNDFMLKLLNDIEYTYIEKDDTFRISFNSGYHIGMDKEP